MKLLVTIAHYGNSQENHLFRILEEYSIMDYDIDVIIDTTYQIDIPNLILMRLNSLRQIIYPEDVKYGLSFAHRYHHLVNQDKYDLYLYTENDMLITQKNIEAYIEVTNNLPKNRITGFLRYEIKNEEEEPYLIDLHPDWRITVDKRLTIAEKMYFTLHNLHQGCWLLTEEQLKMVISSGGFVTKPHESNKLSQQYMTLECGASDIYINCGFLHKVFPHQLWKELLIHHLPNKYVNQGDRWVTPGALTTSQFQRLLDLD